MILRHLGLFEGIGGFSLAARWMGWETVAWCEWNEFCQKVLRYHFPEAEGHGDITKTDFTKYANKIDIITGGFPCQPYSLAGKRKGTADDRHLWPEMLRTIREIQPRWIVGENVNGIINWNRGMVFNQVQIDLETEGYEVFPYVLPSAGVGASHKRDRVWFVAHNSKIPGIGYGERLIQNKQQGIEKKWGTSWFEFHLGSNKDTPIEWRDSRQNIEGEPALISHTNGLSYGLDGIAIQKWAEKSNECYGNAIVPQVALEIYKAIEKYETHPTILHSRQWNSND